MIRIDVPGLGRLRLAHLVLDFNGTLARDGRLAAGVASRLGDLSTTVRLAVLTADTFGGARGELEGLPCEVVVLGSGDEDVAKADYVESLGADTTAAVGNGRNDRRMLREAALGIAVVQEEGAAWETLSSADLIFTDICAALDCFLKPRRLVAGLRV